MAKITVRLPEARGPLLRASAAFHGQTPEEYAAMAVESCIVGSFEAMETAMKD